MPDRNSPDLTPAHADAQELQALRDRVAQLEQESLARQTTLSNVIRNIRATLDLDRIFDTTTRELRHLIDVDRVGVFRFFPHTGYNDGEFVAEDVAEGYTSALAARVRDRCFGDQFSAGYHAGRIQAVGDIYNAGLSDCHIDILARFQVRANLVVPLMKGGTLWGLLCVHHCRAPRHWTDVDVQFVREVALHLDIAIQHVELVERARQQSQQYIERIADNAPGAMYQFRVDAEGRRSFPYFSPSGERFLELPADRIEADAELLFDLIHPDDRDRFEASFSACQTALDPWQWDGRILTPSSQLRWVEGRARPEPQADGSVLWFGWLVDVSDRKAAEAERQTLVSIVENSADFIGITNAEGVPQYLNPAGRRMVGVPLDAPLTRYAVLDFVAPHDRSRIENDVMPSIRDRGTWRSEMDFQHFQTGEVFPVDYHVFALNHPETGEFIGLATVTRDMRDRKAAELALRYSEQRFRDVSEAAGEYLWETDRDGRYTFISEQSQAVKGHASDRLLGRTAFEVMDPRDEAHVREVLRVAQTNRERFQLEHRDITADGNVVWEAVSGIPRCDDAGEFIGFRGAGMSITERKRAEEAWQRTLADLNAILDNLADGLLVVSPRGTIARFNPQLRQMFAIEDCDLTGRTCDDCGLMEVGALVAQVKRDDAESAQTTGEQTAQTAEIQLADRRIGQAIATRVYETLETDGERVVVEIGTVVLIRDITADKEVDRMKTDFISTVSHELRTPLTSVLGFAAIVLEKLEDKVFPAIPEDARVPQKQVARVRKNLQIIVAEAERLTTLINDVLDIAKMEAGKVEWKIAPLSLAEVLERAIAATSALVNPAQLTLETDIAADLPTVMGDRDRLIQVAINLLSNAIKFTERGTVTVRVRRTSEDSEAGDRLRVEISDTGIGIAPQDLTKVFDKFKQVGETLTDKPKGTGLGLPICQQIVEHHGGRIWVESELGQGSTFVFDLPVASSLPLSSPGLASPESPQREREFDVTPLVEQLRDRVNAATAPNADRPQPTILVVDDDPHVRELLRQSLTAQGYRVEQAKNGVDAIVQVKRSRPDLIVLDVMMPDIDGFDVAAVLKNEPQTRGIPILVLSIVEDRERGYRLGIDRYLKKPIDRQELLQEVGTLLSVGASGKTVLVVDRDASTLKVLSEVLNARGYTVAEASDDRECVDKARAIEPDIIAIDSEFMQQHERLRTLRFEKGLEDVVFVLLGEPQSSQPPSE